MRCSEIAARSGGLQYLEFPQKTVTGSVPQSPLCRLTSHRFEELVLPLLDSIYDSARYLSRNGTEAEDLVQDTCLRALRGFRTFETGTNFRAWIFQILKNTFSSSRTSAQYRMRHLHFSLDEMTTPVQSRVPDQIEILLYKSQLVSTEFAVQRLPAFQRKVLMLCDLEGLSYRDAAQELSIPLGTVMSRLARARKAIRRSIQENMVRRRARGTSKTRDEFNTF